MTATDAAGNVSSGTFAVTVVPLSADTVTFAQRTDGSKLVDVYYTLLGGSSSVGLSASYDGGATFNSVLSLSGDAGDSVSSGMFKHIVWNAGADYPGAGSSDVKMRVTALELIGSGTVSGVGGTFVKIPSGTYLRGDSTWTTPDAPLQTVAVNEYYISVNDMTKAQWDAVRDWAFSNGYSDLAVGAGKASNHPVQTVSWYDAVKWANAASEKEGLKPSYTLYGAVYRTGRSDAVVCDWTANGYRLPTEAEWEVAARGGLESKQYPWGNFGYYNMNCNGGNTSFQSGFSPYTSPVGSYAANGYGLYDMAGNVAQWCWDWYGTMVAGSDPRGPRTGSKRILRGGSWYDYVDKAQCSARSSETPSLGSDKVGFRLVRSRFSGTTREMSSNGGLVDTTAPVLVSPLNKTVAASSANGGICTYSAATATDNLTPNPVITYSKASGTVFPVGINTVTVTATDAAGNLSAETFLVTVVPSIGNVTFSQRTDGSKLVDVYYTLTGDAANVVLSASYNGGTTFSSLTSLTGDVGDLISAGTSKHIVWNAGRDYSSSSSSNVKLQVNAVLEGGTLTETGGAFASIPAGTYQTGNLVGDADITDAPVQTVRLSAYYMSVNDTTKAQWNMVRAWGLDNGYIDLPEGDGKGSNHPVVSVSWYDVVKWCNAASEHEGRTPCYTVDGTVYRAGESDSVVCDWTANGYRLPTEAEWEVAARGGLSGKRFPWGDTISLSQANYYANPYLKLSYDLNKTVDGVNPLYADGFPRTSPVGSFPPNGYGLFDMAGN
ncbi:MAG: HYR domain-containing protein, partial [Verrucomicrobia bacterium]|nr:HYR domain-containing protein [Verrucomicrobiota bacterium]